MKIMLIYPPISTLERYSSEIGHAGGRQAPLGLLYLAAYMREQNHQVKLVDGEALGLTAGDIVDQAREYDPDIIGLSSTTVAFHRALEVANEIKAHNLKARIVLGGPHVTVAAEDSLKHEAFDFGILGEGEVAFQNFLSALENNEDISSRDGLAYRQNGRVMVNPAGPPIPALDVLPFPAYDMLPDLSLYNPPPSNYKKLPVANITTSRGCPNFCTFCDRSVFGRKLRQRSAQNIAEEIEYLSRHHHVREIAFVDENFTVRPKLIYELFDILDQKGLKFPWTCMSRVDTVNYEVLEFMKKKGCWHISFGIESGNTEILKRIRKKISLEQASKVIDWCHGLGILTKGFFIVGHPGETSQTIDESIRLALALALDDVVVTINTPLIGTEQYEQADQYGQMDRQDWTRFNMWTPVFVPNGMTEELLKDKHREFYRRFYLRPRIIKRYAASFLSPAGVHRFKALLKTIPFLLKTRGKKRSVNPAAG